MGVHPLREHLEPAGPQADPERREPHGGGSFGSAVALSQNGNTALIGGSGDSAQDGAAWVFTRAGTKLGQQGPKLTPSDEVSAPSGGGFGSSVALSADGNTALIGGPPDFNDAGAAWTFVRSGRQLEPAGSQDHGQHGRGRRAGPGRFRLGGRPVGRRHPGPDRRPERQSGLRGCLGVQSGALVREPGGERSAGRGHRVGLSVLSRPGRAADHLCDRHGALARGVGSINQATGVITYVSQPGFIGTDSFTYVASDAGGTSQPATVAVTVPPAPPTCAATSASSAAGAARSRSSCHAPLPRASASSMGSSSPPVHGTLSALNQSANSVIYTPSPGFNGSDTFTYDASDSGGVSKPPPRRSRSLRRRRSAATSRPAPAGEGSPITVLLSCTGPDGRRSSLHDRLAHRTAPGSDQPGSPFGALHPTRRLPRQRSIHLPGNRSRREITGGDRDDHGPQAARHARLRTAGVELRCLRDLLPGPLDDRIRRASRDDHRLVRGTDADSDRPVTVINSTRCKNKQHRCKTKSRPHSQRRSDTPAQPRSLPVGSRLTVSLTKRGFIGKAYIFTMRAGKQPAWHATCLAPGSTIPGRGC